MPRKERKQKKLAKTEPTPEKARAKIIMHKDEEGSSVSTDPKSNIETIVPDGPPPQPTGVEKTPVSGTEPKFQALCMGIQKALNSEEGVKLNCRLRILVKDKEAVVYQGLIGNVWGRFRDTGNHNIYRHALKNLLMNNAHTVSMNFQ